MYVIVCKVCNFILSRICMFSQISTMNLGVGIVAGIPFI